MKPVDAGTKLTVKMETIRATNEQLDELESIIRERKFAAEVLRRHALYVKTGGGMFVLNLRNELDERVTITADKYAETMQMLLEFIVDDLNTLADSLDVCADTYVSKENGK